MAKTTQETKEMYKAVISESTRELTAKERIMYKDLGDCIALDEFVSDTMPVEIDLDTMVTLDVHNEKAEGDKDYQVIVLVAKDGQKYKTGSQSVINAVHDILSECEQAGLKDIAIKVLKKPSKNYNGRYFMTATLA